MRASAIRHLAAAQSGTRVAAALFEHTVQIWDLNTAEQLSEFNTVLDFGGRRLALSPSGQYCVTAAWSKGKRGGVACYNAMTGVEVWHRVDIRHTQRLRFSSTGHNIFCGLDNGRLQNLSVSTGETLDALAGLMDIVDSPYTSHLMWESRSRGFLIKGPHDFSIARLTFGLLDAVFGPDALCLSEAGGTVRCVDCRTAQERWRYGPPEGHHVIRLSYLNGFFYGVEWGYQHGTRPRLMRFSPEDGREEQICVLNGWEHEFCLGTELLTRRSRNQTGSESQKLEPPSDIAPRPANIGRNRGRQNFPARNMQNPVGEVLITSDGEVVRVADGETIRRLEFPQMDYPEPDR